MLTNRLTVCVLLAIFFFGCSKDEGGLDEAALNLIEAREAIDAGDTDKAIELLDAAIAARPDTWAYYERGKLHAENGDDELANADAEAGLELDAEHSDLLYLQKQLKKSKKARFKTPAPSVNK